MRSIRRGVLPLLLLLAAIPCMAQNCGWSKVDHEVAYDASGMWNPNVYRSIVGALTIAEIGGAVWDGSETRLGKTMWQGIDSQIISLAGATAGKYIFTRARPNEGNNPCLWFQGGSNYSFPSGEAAFAAGLVTPYVLEYGPDQPAMYALLCCRCTSASDASRTRTTGRPTSWPAGRWAACRAGLRTAWTRPS